MKFSFAFVSSRIFIMTDAAAAVTTSHISVQPFRPVFLASPGRPPVPWGRWHCMFEDWLMAVGFPDDLAFAARKGRLSALQFVNAGSGTVRKLRRRRRSSPKALRTAGERHLCSRAVHPMSTASRSVRDAVRRSPTRNGGKMQLLGSPARRARPRPVCRMVRERPHP